MNLRHSCLSVLAAVWLAGCGGGSDSTLGTSGSGPATADQLLSSVFLGRLNVGGVPVSNTEVKLRLSGREVASATSDETGDFRFDLESLDSDVKSELLTRVAPGSADVVAIIDGARYSSAIPSGAQFAWVNEVTTLIHDYLEAHPGATFDEADAAVGRSLGCPAGERVETLSDEDIFDPATFQQQAASHGGDAAFFAEVEANLGIHGYDFSKPDPYNVLEYDGQDTHERENLLISPFGISDAVFGLGMGVLGDIGARAFGWVISRLGSNTDPTINEVVDRLVTLQGAISGLNAELNQQFALSAWRTALGNLSDSVTILDDYGRAIRSAGQNRDPVTDSPFIPPASVPTYLNQNNFSAENARFYANQFLNAIFGRTPGSEVVLSYHRAQMQALGRSNPAQVFGFYDLRYNQVTRQLQRNLNFSLSQVQRAADMLAETSHSQFLRAQNLSAPPLNTLPVDIGAAREFLVRGGSDLDVANRMRRALQMVPPLLDRDDILALPPTFPAQVSGTPTLLLRSTWLTHMTHPDEFGNFPNAHRSFLQRTVGAPWGDVDNWSLPSLAQMREIDRIATAAGNGDARQGLIRLGIYPNAASVPGFLYRDAASSTGQRTVANRFGARIVRFSRFDVWLPTSTREAGRVVNLQYERGDGAAYLGALFVRGSLSGGTPEQFRTVLATGTTVRPTLSVGNIGDRQVTATGSYNFPSGQQFNLDLTTRVAWHSSNPNGIEVSNLSGAEFPQGTMISTRNEPATFTAALMVDQSRPLDADGYVTGQATLTTGYTTQVRNIAITPRNIIVTQGSNPRAYFYCTAFSSSQQPVGRPTHQTRDVTNSPFVDWTLRGPNGQVVPANQAVVTSAFNGQAALGGILRVLDPSLPSGVYTVEARLTGSDFQQSGSVFTDVARVRLDLQ